MKLRDQIEAYVRDDLLQILLVVLGTILVVRFFRWVVSRIETRMAGATSSSNALVLSEEGKRRNALLGVVTYLGVIITWAVGGFMVLDRIGINTGPLLASAGVVGLAVGFGAQSLVRDVVTGFFVIAEGQYGVGDVVEVNANSGLSGTVERLTLRTTVLRSVAGEAHIIPNGEIKSVTNKTKEWSRAVVDVGISYSADLDTAFAALDRAAARLEEDADLAPFLLDPPEVWGVETLGDASLRIRVVARTLPLKQWEVGRRLRRLILDELDVLDVTLPTMVPAVPAPKPVAKRKP